MREAAQRSCRSWPVFSAGGSRYLTASKDYRLSRIIICAIIIVEGVKNGLPIGKPEGTPRGQMKLRATSKNMVRLQFVRSSRAGFKIALRETRSLNQSRLLLPMSTWQTRLEIALFRSGL